MKKMISLLLVAVIILTMSLSTLAASGDIAGKIYSTDIRAYINGVEVKSYNIGGKTAVVIEDILKESARQCFYNNDLRTLTFFSLSPDYLVEEKAEQKVTPGKVIGNIYETDIKTIIYDIEIPSFNIGGKTAVAIEDLGYNGEFSPIGGKFIWNEKERTISLEFLYESTILLSRDKNINITVNDDMTEATAVFEEGFHCEGYQQRFSFPDNTGYDVNTEVIVPIKAQDEVIGHYFRRPLKDNSYIAFTCYYPEKFKEAEKIYTPAPAKTKEEIISHFLNHTGGIFFGERFDADGYSFVYSSLAGTSWTAYTLVQVYDDGTYIDYASKIHMSNRSPINLVIDKENEKVTFKHVDRYNSDWFTNYEIKNILAY